MPYNRPKVLSSKNLNKVARFDKDLLFYANVHAIQPGLSETVIRTRNQKQGKTASAFHVFASDFSRRTFFTPFENS